MRAFGVLLVLVGTAACSGERSKPKHIDASGHDRFAHFETTSPRQRAEIDVSVGVCADPRGGGDATRAARKLARIGHAAVPRIVAHIAALSLKEEDSRMTMAILTHLLQEITGKGEEAVFRFLRGGLSGDERDDQIRRCENCRRAWIEWWDSSDGRAHSASVVIAGSPQPHARDR